MQQQQQQQQQERKRARTQTSVDDDDVSTSAGAESVHELVVPLIDARGRFVHGLVPTEPALNPLSSLFLDAWGMNAYTAHVFVPSMHPASLCRSDLPRLQSERFLVSLKTDGVRVQLVMYASQGGRSGMAALIDRQFRAHVFSRAALDARPAEHWILASSFAGAGALTVIDAELVGDGAEQSDETRALDSRRGARDRVRSVARAVHRARPRLVCHDAVCLLGVSLVNTPFESRVRALRSFVDRLRSAPQPPPPLSLLDLSVKPWFSDARSCVASSSSSSSSGASSAGHEHDGLILAAARGLLRNGIATDMFKWKPRHTVDVFCLRGALLATDGPRPVRLDAASLGADVAIDHASFRALLSTAASASDAADAKEDEQDEPEEVDYDCLVARSRVVEAAVERAADVLVLRALKLRTDKPLGNDLRIVRRTLQNVREDIALHELSPAENDLV